MKLYFFTYKVDGQLVPVVDASQSKVKHELSELHKRFKAWEKDRNDKIIANRRDFLDKPYDCGSVTSIRTREYSLNKEGLLAAFAGGMETGAWSN
jgi:hypothetical protein